jgi:formylglycine-generating enzyme required for sulfatase activity
LDACRDKGDEARGGEGVGKQTEKEAREKGIITIFSCSPNELSWELEELEQGVFTYALLEGLSSKGKRATVEKLNEYLRYRVQELSQKKGKRQTPRIIAYPIEKSHLILMPKYATLSDISFLKNYAARAERKKEWQKAKSLWRRVLNAAQGADEDAIEALNNIAIEERLGKIDENSSVIKSDVAEVKSSNLREKVSSKELEKGELFTFEVVKVKDSGSIVNSSQGSATQKIENLGNGVSLEMVKIPGGSFLMGSPDTEAERFDREGPQHYVNVPEFFMGKYVVTQGQWKAIAYRTDLKVELDLEPDPSRFKEPYKDIDRWNRPVERVKWYEAVEFCKRLSKLTGRNYRLPSEAEWEYACRAGTTIPFYFGETITTELVNYDGNYTYGNGPKGEYRKQTIPVGQFPANAFGLYDMHGNVWEWCEDEWHDNYAGAPTDGSVWLNGDKERSPLRGGSWAYSPDICRSAIRSLYIRRDDLCNLTGFRLVCDGGRTL